MNLDQFKALSLPERGRAFLAWAKTKPSTATYDAEDSESCALVQFGQSLTDEKCNCYGSSYCFTVEPDESGEIEVLKDFHDYQSPIHAANRLSRGRTRFGELVINLEAHLARETLL